MSSQIVEICSTKHSYRFRETECLGRGTYGRVQRAIRTQDGLMVAIKRITKDQGKPGYNPKYIQREIQLLSILNCRGIVGYYEDFHTDDGKHNIVLEYLNGGELRQYIKRIADLRRRENQTSPYLGLYQKEAVVFLKQIIISFQALHEQKIIHRDVKTSNFVLHQSEVKMIDLGLARRAEQPGQVAAMTIAGTPTTRAPEVNTGRYNNLADIWSIGIIFHEMLFGSPPQTTIFRTASPLFNNQRCLNQIQAESRQTNIDLELEEKIFLVSKNTFMFLSQCLRIRLEERLSWQQLYNHPLITEIDCLTNEENINEVLEKVRHTHIELSHNESISDGSNEAKEHPTRENLRPSPQRNTAINPQPQQHTVQAPLSLAQQNQLRNSFRSLTEPFKILLRAFKNMKNPQLYSNLIVVSYIHRRVVQRLAMWLGDQNRIIGKSEYPLSQVLPLGPNAGQLTGYKLKSQFNDEMSKIVGQGSEIARLLGADYSTLKLNDYREYWQTGLKAIHEKVKALSEKSKFQTKRLYVATFMLLKESFPFEFPANDSLIVGGIEEYVSLCNLPDSIRSILDTVVEEL